MSGIAVVANADGRPADRQLLAAMAEALQVRGPDVQAIWTDDGPIGLVHSLFQTTEDEMPRPQPFSFDGTTWITADARIDARAELRERLRGLGRQIELTACDAELILHAWHVWGSACVEHLLGDFSFAVVDTSQRRVFAARDHLGIKPLFYARVGEGLVITNDLDCARLHPQVSNTLDDSWVCDFLLFGWNMDATASVFQDIRRLPGGHRLEWTPEGLTIERYWSLEVPEEMSLRNPQEYVERFNDVFEKAVIDRLRTKRVSISMSGGLDSTAIAAKAVQWARRHAPETSFYSLTAVWDPILPNDHEREFAAEAAQFLGIPIEFVEGQDHSTFDAMWDSPETQMPEPSERNYRIFDSVVFRARDQARVMLYGEGGDEAISPHPTYFPQLLRERRYWRWLLDVGRYLRWQRKLPPIGLRTAIRSLVYGGKRRSRGVSVEFPGWIADALVPKFELKSRWESYWNLGRGSRACTPRGLSSLTCLLPYALSSHDAIGLRGPIELRYPWLDLRVINSCWSIPPVPMRFSKLLVRHAMHGLLPLRVLNRPKAALAGDPLVANYKRHPCSWEAFVGRAVQLNRYVQLDPLLGSHQADENSNELWLRTRPFELASWLYYRSEVGGKGVRRVSASAACFDI